MKPLSLASFMLIALFILTTSAYAQTCPNQPASAHHGLMSKTMKRGVNLSRWWEDTRDQIPTEADFSQIVESGFDFVRLPVAPVWFTTNDDQVTQLHCDLLNLTAHGLKVIVDLHAVGAFKNRQVDSDADTATDNILAVWQRIAPALDNLPVDQILIGIYNEPGIKTDQWWAMQGKLIATLRPLFPHHYFVATTAPNSGVWEYAHLHAYDDPHIYYDFHFYEPMVLTHHKAPWVKMFQNGAGSAPVTYPYTSHFSWDTDDSFIKDYVDHQWNKEQLRHYVHDMKTWAANNHASVLCLEFGIYRDGNEAQSRLNWLNDIRALLEENGIPWALWEYRGSFGLLDKAGHYDRNMALSLGLTAPPQSP